MDNHVVPECYIDTMLLKALVPPKKRFNHQHGCHNVARELESGKLKDKFGVGIIDNDQKQVKYLGQFKEIDRYLDENGIGAALYNKKHHYFIQICPEIERLILKVCMDEGIDLANADYSLPDDIIALSKITKSQNSEHDTRFLRLFQKFKQTENRKLKKLSGWLRLLIKKNYQADINELKNV
jgi:hypothetical protein